MSMNSFELPVELWREILAEALDPGGFPDKNATLFEKVNAFPHPCKLYHQVSRNRLSLCLVCRLWNEIIKTENPVLFIEACQNEYASTIQLSRRVEVIAQWDQYCQKWPCLPFPPDCKTHEGWCQPSGSGWYPSEKMEKIMPFDPESFKNVRMLRLYKSIRGPTQLLHKCINLEVLWILFFRVYELIKEAGPSFLSHLQHLSYLHLDAVVAVDVTSALHLPALKFLRIGFSLHGPSSIFPLDIQVPSAETIMLFGRVRGHHIPSLEKLVNSCRNSLVNLVLSFIVQHDATFFPLGQLAQFPLLTTLGLGVDGITFTPENSFAAVSSSPPSPLSLVLFGLHTDLEHYPLPACKRNLLEMFAATQKWFSKIVIASEWDELRDFKSSDTANMKRVMLEASHSAFWSLLNDLHTNGIIIQDQNGVELGEENGSALPQQMRAVENKTTVVNAESTGTEDPGIEAISTSMTRSSLGKVSKTIDSYKKKIKDIIIR